MLRSKQYRKLSIVTTNCEKSAEVIVPKKFFSGRTEQFKKSIVMYVLCTYFDKR